MNIQLLRKLGNIAQIAGINTIKKLFGKAQETCIAEVYNAAGLRFSVLLDKCMDLYDMSFNGINLAFKSKNGLVSNKFFNALDEEFFSYWSGGMLSTCGLANAGPSCTDEGYHPIHGRIGNIPANHVAVDCNWVGEDYVMSISGEMNESVLYRRNMQLKRRITTSLYAKELHIHDTITNFEPNDEEFMLLYHFNFGYPFLDEGTRLYVSHLKVTQRTNELNEHWNTMEAPEVNIPQQVFIHECKGNDDGYAYAAVINHQLSMGAYVKYKTDHLPVLVEWKGMGAHDYVLGVEPSNSYILGRSDERKNGTLPQIAAYSSIDYEVTLGVLSGVEEIEAFIKKQVLK